MEQWAARPPHCNFMSHPSVRRAPAWILTDVPDNLASNVLGTYVLDKHGRHAHCSTGKVSSGLLADMSDRVALLPCRADELQAHSGARAQRQRGGGVGGAGG